MDCYNFCHKYKNNFTNAKAKKYNRIFFAAIFFEDKVLFLWQQYKRKINIKTNVPITWKKFKAFLCQSLKKSQAFVNSI